MMGGAHKTGLHWDAELLNVIDYREDSGSKRERQKNQEKPKRETRLGRGFGRGGVG